ncbi:hypothetical protein BX600DRAFT_53025 [Xylariales sp. PMI_506]|nr:hypothetical protein BX600DRAFT_53025 [Xylariales sp. PMI_506]
MAISDAPPSCPRCSRSFTKKSSMVRHRERCLQNVKPVPRRKACRACSDAKLRCDLQRPNCGRCRKRELACEYASKDGAALPPSSGLTTAQRKIGDIDSRRQPRQVNQVFAKVNNSTRMTSFDISADHRQQPESTETFHQSTEADGGRLLPAVAPANGFTPPINDASGPRGSFLVTRLEFSQVIPATVMEFSPTAPAPELTMSPDRRRALLGAAQTPNADVVARHTMNFVIRVLKSWPRMMAAHGTNQLPPMIHRIQLVDGLPTPLANCYTLTKMWIVHAEGSRNLVQQTIQKEVQRLLGEYSSYGEMDLLATAQSLLILLIILLFGFDGPSTLVHPVDAQLLIDTWDVKHALAGTGLFSEHELTHTLPPWREWAIVSAKRRTILGLHHLEWAWSLRHGYPVLTCLELGPLPAPAARYTWQNDCEGNWEHLYSQWLRQWPGEGYKMAELFSINALNTGDALDERSEMWLAEADEFGMMLMAEVNGVVL